MKAIYLITGGKQPDKKQKNISAFEAKKIAITSRIDNIDRVRCEASPAGFALVWPSCVEFGGVCCAMSSACRVAGH